MARQVAIAAAPIAPVAVPKSAPFVMKASKTQVEVRATDTALGMRELLQVMATDPNLKGCVIQHCGFDGQFFSATLRIEK